MFSIKEHYIGKNSEVYLEWIGSEDEKKYDISVHLYADDPLFAGDYRCMFGVISLKKRSESTGDLLQSIEEKIRNQQNDFYDGLVRFVLNKVELDYQLPLKKGFVNPINQKKYQKHWHDEVLVFEDIPRLVFLSVDLNGKELTVSMNDQHYQRVILSTETFERPIDGFRMFHEIIEKIKNHEFSTFAIDKI